MFKNIEDIKKKNIKDQINFFCNCKAQEKIDAHYVSLQIISKSIIKFYKANGNEISHIDLILNDMWKKFVNDWNLILFGNKTYLETHIGYKFSMFFINCEKPLNTKFKPGIAYIIDTIELLNNKKDFYKDFLNLIKIPEILNANSDFIVKNKTNIKNGSLTIENITDLVKNWNNNKITINDFISKIIFNDSMIKSNIGDTHYENPILYALNNPEGIIFKNHKNIYQYNLAQIEEKRNDIGRTPYEYILIMFLKFCRKHQDYINLLTNNYVKTVCNLFEYFIVNINKDEILKNINIEDLQPPYYGSAPKINYEYIPSEKTKSLCQLDKLNENIFKILLVNLTKHKNYKKCVLMNKQQCDDFNLIIKNILVHEILNK